MQELLSLYTACLDILSYCFLFNLSQKRYGIITHFSYNTFWINVVGQGLNDKENCLSVQYF